MNNNSPDILWIIYISILWAAVCLTMFIYIRLLQAKSLNRGKILSHLTLSKTTPEKQETAYPETIEETEAFQKFMKYSYKGFSHIPKESDWLDLESTFNHYFPSFEKKLLSSYQLSEIELRTSILIKLGMKPKQIATLLCHSKEAVASIRRRLCMKVLKSEVPTPEEWDAFVQQL